MTEGETVDARGQAPRTNSETWDAEFDFVVAGSGGGGLTAALAAVDGGASVLVLEKQALIGGSTCMSGGVVWIPNNPLMQRGGIADSYEDGMTHFESVVGDVGPASSKERRDAFLTAGPEMVEFLERCGVRFARCDGYSDYYSNKPGGKDIGRAIEPVPWNAKALGDWRTRLQPGLAQSVGLAVMTNESRSLSHYNRSPRCFALAARVVIRTYGAKARRQALLTNGASLIGQMLRNALDRGIPVWTEAPLDDLVVEDGRVVGVRTVRDGKPWPCAPGTACSSPPAGSPTTRRCARSTAATSRTGPRWSIANPGDTGEALLTAIRLGAATDLMDEAWWLPNPRTGRFGQSTLDQARQRPRTIMVDAAGNRFVNESNSYMEVGKAMYARDKTAKAVPAWLIFDDRYRKRYAHQRSHPGHFPKKLLESGNLKQAWTLADLANMCGIDPAGLAATVERFNEHARNGVDPDYGRGESAYNRALGDPRRGLHPCLGPIDEGPYYAVQMLPSDIGTCGGLVTDEAGRVLDESGAPIAGLYSTGNSTATVMGRHYLGPGASIANSMVFGYLAARQVAHEATEQAVVSAT